MALRDDLRQKLIDLRAWAIGLDADGVAGWPATRLGQEPGVWTTAQFVRALSLSHRTEALDAAGQCRVNDAVEWLLGSRLPERAWPLIGGTTPSLLATAAVSRALNEFLKWPPHANADLAERALLALQQASRWMLNAQLADNGWDFGSLATLTSGSHVTPTASAIASLANVLSDHEGDPFASDITDALSSGQAMLLRARDVAGFWATPGNPDGDSNATSRALIALHLAGRHAANDPSFASLEKFYCVTPWLTYTLPITEDEVTGPAGIVTIYNDPAPAVVEAIATLHFDSSLLFDFAAGISRRNVTSGTPLTCPVTGREWETVTWPSAANIATLSCLLTLSETEFAQRMATSVVATATRLVSYGDSPPSFVRTACEEVIKGGEPLSIIRSQLIFETVQDGMLCEAVVRILCNAGLITEQDSLTLLVAILARVSSLPDYAAPTPVVHFDVSTLHDYRVAIRLALSGETLAAQEAVRSIITINRDTGILSDRIGLALSIIDLLGRLEKREQGAIGFLVQLKAQIDTLSSISSTIDISEERELLSYCEAAIQQHWSRLDIAPEYSCYTVEAPPVKGTFRAKFRVSVGPIPIEDMTLSLAEIEGAVINATEITGVKLSSGTYEFSLLGETDGSGRVRFAFFVGGRAPTGEISSPKLSYEVATRLPEPSLGTAWVPIRFRYTVGKYLTNPAVIVGREAFMRRLAEKIERTPTTIALNGSWRIGKSTFMRNLQHTLDRNESVRTIYLDLQSLPSGLTGLLDSLRNQMVEAITALPKGSARRSMERLTQAKTAVLKGLEGLDITTFGIHVTGDPDRRYVTAIETAKKAFRDVDALLLENRCLLVIFLDEVNEIAKYEDAALALSLLRSIIQQSESVRVVAGSFDIFAPFEPIDRTFFNIFEEFDLQPFSIREVESLLALAEGKLHCSAGVLREIARITGGIPFLVSALADELVELANAKSEGTVTLEAVEQAIASTSSRAAPLFNTLWQEVEGSGIGAPELCRLMAANGGALGSSFTGGQTTAAPFQRPEPGVLARLRHKGIVLEVDGHLELICPMFSAWVRQNS